MTMLRGAFSNLLVPGFKKVLFETYRERPTEGDKLVNMNTSKRSYEEVFNIAGFGTLFEKPEGGPVVYTDALQGNVKRYVWTTFGGGFRITQEMVEDDLYGVMGNKMSKALGRSVRNNFEVVAHSPYNNAFNTAFVGLTAGESLCGSHTTLRGLTLSNTPANPADFGLLAFQAAIEHFHGLLDESGLPVMFMPRMIVYNPGDLWMVSQVLKSQYLPGTNLNDVNEAANQGVVPHLSHYLTDSDAWFVLADQHDVNYFDRRPPTFSNADDFESGDAKFKVTRRNGAGYGDWRGIFGSPGQ